MDTKKEGLFSKANSVISAVFGILLGPSSPIETPKGQPLTHNQQDHQIISQIGLKTLIPSSSNELQAPTTIITKPYTPLPSPSPPPLSRSSSGASTASLSRSSSYLSRSSSVSLDELIGSDSGVHMSNDEDKSLSRSNSICNSCNTRKKSRVRNCCVKGRDYPPPIPSLARSGSLPGRMPWVMTRKYDNGKLILREERAKHREYIEARREEGRLIMKLVPFEDPISIHRSGIEDIKDGSGHDQFDAQGEYHKKSSVEHVGSKDMINKDTYEAIDDEMTLQQLPHIEDGDAKKLLQNIDTFNLQSSATVSFSVCAL